MKMKSLMLQILMAAAQLRAAVGKFLTGLPFWPDVVRISTRICAPLVAFARWTLAAMPSLRKAEWLLEIESLTKRHPVTLAVSLAFVFFRGIKPTSLGHIGTDLLIYPFLAAVSGFNPFLGVVCGVVFGIGDLIQKLLWNDIYATKGWGWFDLAYWGAIFGYIIAYSSTMTMGLLPGMASRTFRLGARFLIARFAFKKAAAAADGARPPSWNDPPLPDKKKLDPWGNPLEDRVPEDQQGWGDVSPGHIAGARAYGDPSGWGDISPGHIAGAHASAEWGAQPTPPAGDGGYMAGHLAGARAYGSPAPPSDGGYMAGHLAGARANATGSNVGPVTALFNRATPVEEHPAAKAAREFHQALNTNPKLQAEIRALQADPRNLLGDPNAWRSEDLTPRQKTLLAQLRGQRLLGPDGNQRLNQMIGGQSAVAPQFDGGGSDVNIDPPPPGPGGGGSMSLLELLAGMLGGSLAAAEHMLVNAGGLEAAAFMLRGQGRNDVGCLKLEVDKFLRGRAPELGFVGAGAGAIDGLSKAGPGSPDGPRGGGSRGGGGASPADLANRLDDANNFNFNNVDPETGAEIQRRINKLYEDKQNGRLNEADLIELENLQRGLTAQNKAELDQRHLRDNADNRAVQARLDAEQAARDAQQARLRDEYDRIVKKYSGGGLESANNLDTISNWHDRVVKGGMIDAQALEDMTRILGGKTAVTGGREFDLATAVADAKDRQMKAAGLVRDTAFAAAGGLAGGAVMAGLGTQSLIASALVNSGIGGFTAAASAASDYWGDPNMGNKMWDAAKSGAIFGGTFAGVGGAAGKGYLGDFLKGKAEWLGKNPTLGGHGIGAIVGGGMAWWNGEDVLGGALHGGFLGGVGGKFGAMGHNKVTHGTWDAPDAPHVSSSPKGGDAGDFPTERPGTRPTGEMPTEKGTPVGEHPTERPGARASTELPTEKGAAPELPTEKAGKAGGGTPTEKGGSPELPTEKAGKAGGGTPTEKAGIDGPTEKAGGKPSSEGPTEKAGMGAGGDEPDVPFSREEPLTPAQEAEINKLSKLSRDQLDKLADDAHARGDVDRLELIEEAQGRKQVQGGEALAEPLDLNNRQAEVDRLSKYSVENLKRLEEYHRSQGNTAEADLVGDALKKRTSFGSPSHGIEPEVQRLSELPPAELDRRLAIAKANGDANLTRYLEAAKTMQHQRGSSEGLPPDYNDYDQLPLDEPPSRRPGSPPETPPETPPKAPDPVDLASNPDVDYYARNYRPADLEDLVKYYKYRGRMQEASVVEEALKRQQANGLDKPWSTPAAEGPQPEVLPGAKNRPPGVKVDPLDLNNRQAEIKRLSETTDLQHMRDLENHYRSQGDTARADLVRDARNARVARALDRPMSPEDIERVSHSQRADLDWDLKQAQKSPQESAQRIKDLQEAIRLKEARDAAAAANEVTNPGADRPRTPRTPEPNPDAVTDPGSPRPKTPPQAPESGPGGARSNEPGFADKTDPGSSRPGTSRPDTPQGPESGSGGSRPGGAGDAPDPSTSRPGTNKPTEPGPGDATDPGSSRPGKPGPSGEDLKAETPKFNAARDRMQQAEANLKAAEASGDPGRVKLARENFEDARSDYNKADPRRAYKAAVEERELAQSKTASAEKAAADAKDAAAKAARQANANPDSPELQEQARQAKAAADKARLDNIEAEQRRFKAGEDERAAAQKLREHMAKEAKLKEQIDAKVQKDLGAEGPERKGGMRVVADSDALRDQQKDFKRVDQEWYPRTDSPEVDPKNLVGDNVAGFNDPASNRSAGLPDQGALTHERFHANTSQGWKDTLGRNTTLNEGITHNLTIEQGEATAAGGSQPNNADWAPAIPKAYPQEVQIVRKLESIVGKDTVRNAYSKGDTDSLMAAVGKRAGAPPGSEIEVGRQQLEKIDMFNKIAKWKDATPGQRATAQRNLDTLLNQLERGTP